MKRGKTPVLAPEEARRLLDSIDVATPSGLRDRALIALMVFSFARIGAALKMRVEDAYVQNRRLWVRLHDKGGKRHEMPCHHSLEAYLHAYIDGCGLGDESKGSLFRTIGRGTGRLSKPPPAPSQCVSDGAAAGHCRRHWDGTRKSLVPRDRDHSVSEEWRHVGKGGSHGQSYFDADDPAL